MTIERDYIIDKWDDLDFPLPLSEVTKHFTNDEGLKLDELYLELEDGVLFLIKTNEEECDMFGRLLNDNSECNSNS